LRGAGIEARIEDGGWRIAGRRKPLAVVMLKLSLLLLRFTTRLLGISVI
jgi:hypothetical protein